MRNLLAFVRLSLFLSFACHATNSDPVYKALRDAAIQESFPVENLVIRRDGGVLTLKSGTVGLTTPQMGRDTVAVFSGDGEFAFAPAVGLEGRYMKSLTGAETVQERFDRALFCFTDETGKELRGKAKTGGDSKLGDILRDYRKRLRTRNETPRSMLEAELNSDTMENIEAEILADLYNPSQAGFFSAYLHGRTHGDLRFHVKPRGAMPELPSPEEVAVINVDPGGPSEGIWYLSHLRSETHSEIQKGQIGSSENKRAVQAVSYKIDTTIASNDHFTASTDLKYTAITSDRVLRFALRPTLRVAKIQNGSKDVDFIQEDRKEDGSLYVILPDGMKPGASGELHLEYLGDRVVHKAGGGNFSVGARESWYPNVNTFRDHAAYDLTFRVPKRYTLVSVGSLEKAWVEKDAACTHWVTTAPIAVAGFNYGDFKKKQVTDESIHFTLEGYAASTVPDYLKGAGDESMSPSRLTDNALVEAQNAMRIFTAWFGKSAYTRIAITQQPEFSFGQSWPTLVYLPVSAFLDPTQRWMLMGKISSGLDAFVDEVTAHEVSHQWWGHMVGWKSYHDQWLSEGFADFSAGLYLQFTEKNPEKYIQYWETARKRLTDKNGFGRRANDSGPMWMGLRLESFRNVHGYAAVVYGKGGYILHMLRSMMYRPADGDKGFIEMMHDFVQTHMNQNATTENFQAVAEKHMTAGMDVEGNRRLDWFFRQWVYGTTIPRFKFESTLTDGADGKCLLKGSLTQSEVDPSFVSLVPIYADFEGKITRLGTVRVVGNTTADKIQMMLPSKPRRVTINAYHDMLEL